jgi:demethylmenaquinone methyltransferase / 2-methoxy-6-polyprenyl-1,4-benzoquinol methylase
MTSYDKNNPPSIQEMFSAIAQQYDKTNAVVSFQMHRFWNKVLVNSTIGSTPSNEILDLCCGTGEIAFTFLKKKSEPQKAHLLDFCPEMLECAKEKAKKISISHHSINYIQADAENIPLLDSTIDFVTIAYGIRNIKNPANCIREVYRVLKPGGTFGILELTMPKNPLLKYGHQFYLSRILPVLGKMLTSNEKAYAYLCQSIQNFTKPKDLEVILSENGFKETKQIPLLGGIATILVSVKN